MTDRTLDQQRATAAWEAVSDIKNKPDKAKYADKFTQLATKASSAIQINGLGQTIAFWLAKGNGDKDEARAHREIYNVVEAWLKTQLNFRHPPSLKAWIVHRDTSTDDYRRATAETLAFLNWLKRFAEAELEKATIPNAGTQTPYP